MAISGGATTAYKMTIAGDTLRITPTTCLSSLCDRPAEAIAKIRRGETATVAGGDAYTVRVAVTGKDAHGAAVQL